MDRPDPAPPDPGSDDRENAAAVARFGARVAGALLLLALALWLLPLPAGGSYLAVAAVFGAAVVVLTLGTRYRAGWYRTPARHPQARRRR